MISKDILGNEIKVGDTLIISTNEDGWLTRIKIIGETPTFWKYVCKNVFKNKISKDGTYNRALKVFPDMDKKLVLEDGTG